MYALGSARSISRFQASTTACRRTLPTPSLTTAPFFNPNLNNCRCASRRFPDIAKPSTLPCTPGQWPGPAGTMEPVGIVYKFTLVIMADPAPEIKSQPPTDWSQVRFFARVYFPLALLVG